jgi:ABC-type Fe3+ transport system permease subunit
MKRLFRIFELSKNEQRVVLIIVLILLTIVFVAYERRIHPRFQQTIAMEPKPSPSAAETKEDDD